MIPARRPRFAALAPALLGVAALAVALGVPRSASAQVAESDNDPTGISIPYPLVHLVHGAGAAQPGTTGQLQDEDPFLLYQLGKDLLNRQFRPSHGVYGRSGEHSVPLYVDRPEVVTHGGSSRFTRDHTASCGFCHSTPYREPGAGQSIGSTGGEGRSTPHFFGAGLIEMLGEQIRSQILVAYDRDRDGVLSRAEVAAPSPVRIRPLPEAPEIDYGDLSPGADGVPRLNPLFRVWYVDARGELLPDAVSLADPRAAGFGFAPQPFGWGRGTRLLAGRRVAEGGEATTLRGFYTGAADVHMGLQAFDPTQLPMRGGLARVSLAGAQQFDFGGSPDLGRRRTESGLSRDDPDADGYPNELSEGDVDAVELAMLNAPTPAVLATPQSESGRSALLAVGCARCHVESWRIEARDAARGLSGDRRFFELQTRSEPGPDGQPALRGRLVRLDRVLPSGQRVPRGEAFVVSRLYTDFKQWDLGPEFWERRFDGSLQREHRTTPLWGVGSTAPYGHNGRFPGLDEVIQAHGGAATEEAHRYRALPAAERRRLLAYLESLVLYTTDEIPADVDGDGAVAERFEVAGQDVGYERFDARFLFKVAPRYRHLKDVVDAYGTPRRLMLIENRDEAFGLALAFRRDSDRDGFPDAVDPLPQQAGIGATDAAKQALNTP